MKDTPENRKIVKRSFLNGIEKRGLDDWLDEMVAHWLSWEEAKERCKQALERMN